MNELFISFFLLAIATVSFFVVQRNIAFKLMSMILMLLGCMFLLFFMSRIKGCLVVDLLFAMIPIIILFELILGYALMVFFREKIDGEQ